MNSYDSNSASFVLTNVHPSGVLDTQVQAELKTENGRPPSTFVNIRASALIRLSARPKLGPVAHLYSPTYTSH
jgi:hypothetical protein